MDTNAALRKRAFRLVNRLGISQKVLASKMGMPTSTFSKWLNRKGVGPVPVTALDGLNAYLGELREELDLDMTTLSPDDQERIQTQTEALETEHVIKRAERAAKRRRRQRRVGKRVARS